MCTAFLLPGLGNEQLLPDQQPGRTVESIGVCQRFHLYAKRIAMLDNVSPGWTT